MWLHDGVGDEFSPLMMIINLLWKHRTEVQCRETKLGSCTWEEKAKKILKGHGLFSIVDYHLIMWWESGATSHVSHLRMM